MPFGASKTKSCNMNPSKPITSKIVHSII